MNDGVLPLPEALVSVGLAGLGVWAMSRPVHNLAWRELLVPGDLKREQVEAFLSRVAAGNGPVVVVVDARAQSVRFRLGALPGATSGLAGALSGIAPEVVLDEVTPGDDQAEPMTGARAWWPGRAGNVPPLLRTDAPELAVAGLLGSLSAVRGPEQIQLVVRLLPGGRVGRPAGNIGHGELRNKLAGPLLRTEILLTITAATQERARQLRQNVVSALRSLNGPMSRLKVRALSAESTANALARVGRSRSWWLTPRTLLSALARKFGNVWKRSCYAAMSVAESLVRASSRPRSRRVNFHSNGAAICS